MPEIAISSLGISLLAGSLTTLSPCVFPLIPLVVGSAVQANRMAPVAMGLGMVLSFTLVGVFLGTLGAALGIDGDSVRAFGGWMLVVFGAVMLVPQLDQAFARLMSPVASGANNVTSRLNSGSLLGAMGLGALLGLVWSPCSGPLLATALSLVATENGAISRGGAILGIFGVGAAIPLVLISYASRGFMNSSRQWVLKQAYKIKYGFGVLILLVGISILTGFDKRLEAVLVSLMPEAWVSLTTKF
jgi:cytochrome c biogenesis protein CcdA